MPLQNKINLSGPFIFLQFELYSFFLISLYGLLSTTHAGRTHFSQILLLIFLLSLSQINSQSIPAAKTRKLYLYTEN